MVFILKIVLMAEVVLEVVEVGFNTSFGSFSVYFRLEYSDLLIFNHVLCLFSTHSIVAVGVFLEVTDVELVDVGLVEVAKDEDLLVRCGM